MAGDIKIVYYSIFVNFVKKLSRLPVCSHVVKQLFLSVWEWDHKLGSD